MWNHDRFDVEDYERLSAHCAHRWESKEFTTKCLIVVVTLFALMLLLNFALR